MKNKITIGRIFGKGAICIILLMLIFISLILSVSAYGLFNMFLNLFISIVLIFIFIANMVSLGYNIEKYFDDKNRKDNNII